jgi:hypothetical protein
VNLNQELLVQELKLLQEEIQMLELQEVNLNQELLVKELKLLQEEIHSLEWNHQEAAVLNLEWKLQEEIRNQEETAKVLEEEDDKLNNKKRPERFLKPFRSNKKINFRIKATSLSLLLFYKIIT